MPTLKATPLTCPLRYRMVLCNAARRNFGGLTILFDEHGAVLIPVRGPEDPDDTSIGTSREMSTFIDAWLTGYLTALEDYPKRRT